MRWHPGWRGVFDLSKQFWKPFWLWFIVNYSELWDNELENVIFNTFWIIYLHWKNTGYTFLKCAKRRALAIQIQVGAKEGDAYGPHLIVILRASVDLIYFGITSPQDAHLRGWQLQPNISVKKVVRYITVKNECWVYRTPLITLVLIQAISDLTQNKISDLTQNKISDLTQNNMLLICDDPVILAKH